MMDRSGVRGARHHPVEHVQLADEVALPHSADRGVA